MAAGAVVWATVWGASEARAEGRSARLEYVGDCDHALLHARVAGLVEGDLFDPSAATRIRIIVEARPDRARATVVIAHTRGQRVLEAPSCEALADELALIVAVMLATPEPVSEPEPPPEPVEEAAAAVPVLADRRSTTADGRSVLAGAAISDDRDVMVTLGAQLRRTRFSLGIELGIGRTATVEVEPGRVLVGRHAATLTPCLHAGPLAGCAITSIGWIRARAEDLVVAEDAISPFVAVGLRVLWERRLTRRFAIRAGLDVRIPLTRTRFHVDAMPIWATDRVEGLVGLGVAARIP